uniref:Uncharacterized protein n=1 Tax=Alexandrium catenella TaxID=2925 RepID=A0A7S1QXL3_ALECA|mmetsp:Transcript_4063/g.10767  ORF Transcript_4063/g.10767 Transcript_4063/m.10767 type:complete len:371 (+) Transcript_4063:1-1113(+)
MTSKTSSILEDDQLAFTRGPNGLTLQHSTALQRTRGQLRELGQNMLQSMTTSFPRQVWDECQIKHPEQDREERAQALRELKKVKLRAAEKAAEKIRSLEMPLFKTDDVVDGKSCRRSQVIPYKPERQEEKDKLHQEKVIAALARQTGWSVLDVEEVRELFFRHAVGGRIDVHTQPFARLLGDLYTDPSTDEVRTIVHQITRVRRRTARRTLWQSITASQHEEDGHDEPTWIQFSEFYVALAKWLDHQRFRQLTKNCRLSRFAGHDGGSEQRHLREQLAVDHFRREVQAREVEGLSPGEGPASAEALARGGETAEPAADGQGGSRSSSLQQTSEDNSESEGSNIGDLDLADDEDFLQPELPAAADFLSSPI